MATLPPGWVITTAIEEVPNPNNGQMPFSDLFFARRTSTCRDDVGDYVASSGAYEDCENQALTIAQTGPLQWRGNAE